jgi:hypothetical protein
VAVDFVIFVYVNASQTSYDTLKAFAKNVDFKNINFSVENKNIFILSRLNLCIMKYDTSTAVLPFFFEHH